MPIVETDHNAIRTADMEATRDFYVKVLGLTDGPRPDLGYHGYWIYLGKQAIIHLIAPGREMGGGDGANTGNFDHMALSGQDFPAMKKHLTELGVEFRERHVPNARLRQIFVYDPNRILVEINFRNTD